MKGSLPLLLCCSLALCQSATGKEAAAPSALADAPANTWVKMNPTFNPPGYDFDEFGPQGTLSLYLTCYDKANHATIVTVHGQTWAYRYSAKSW